MAIWKGSTALGYLTWMNLLPGSEAAVARIMVDETDLQALAAGRILLTYLLEQLASSGPRHVGLELPAYQSVLRELAFGLGFRGAPGQAQLTKLVLGKVFTRTTWDACRKELSTKAVRDCPAPFLTTGVSTSRSPFSPLTEIRPMSIWICSRHC